MTDSDKIFRASPITLIMVTTLILLGMGVVLANFWPGVARPPQSSPSLPGDLSKLDRIPPYPFPVTGDSRDRDTEIAFYEKRLEQNPRSSLAMANLARSYLSKARTDNDPVWYRRAEEMAARSLKRISVSNQDAKLILAEVAQAGHRFMKSITLADAVLQESPGSAEARAILVTAHLGLGNIDKAEHHAEILVRRMPTLVPLTLRALVKWRQGKETAALLDFQRAARVEDIGEAESSAWMRCLVARLHLRRGRNEIARELLQETLRFRPDYPLSLALLAELEMNSGNFEQAERFLRKAFDVSGDLIFQVQLARLKDLQGDTHGATQLREETEAKIRRTLVGPYGHPSDLGDLLLDRGRPQDISEAISLFEKEAQKRRDPETLARLAKALALDQRWSEARQIFSEALRGNKEGTDG